MKFGLSLTLFLTLLSGIACADDVRGEAPGMSEEREIDRVIAAIEGEPVTMGDLVRFLSSSGKLDEAGIPQDPVQLNRHLSELISTQLFEREAESLGVSVTDDEVSAYIDEVKRQNGVTSDEFETLLTEQGLDLGDYQRQVRSDIRKTRIMQSLVKSSVNISDEDIKRYLAEHPDQVPQEGQVHLYQIMVDLPQGIGEDGQQTFRKRLEELSAQLSDPADWSKVQGATFADIGYVQTTELRQALQLALSDLPLNQVSPVIATEDAMYLLMILARGGSDWELNSSFKENVRREIYEAKVRERMQKFVTDELPSKYHVEMLLTKPSMGSRS